MAVKTKTAQSAKTPTKVAKTEIAAISKELQNLQRQRAIIIKSRNMQSNRIQAIVAGTIGYSSGMDDKERKKKFAEATEFIKKVRAGEAESQLKSVIDVTFVGIEVFNKLKKDLEKQMLAQAKLLPVAKWVERPEQRGFGLLFLGIIIGETGDLFNYENPAKVWRRMGCAPWTFDGQTLMGATWKGKTTDKLPKLEWTKFGYSPRRRSIAYLIGEGLVKQNGPYTPPELEEGEVLYDSETGKAIPPGVPRKCGPYRAWYDLKKAEIKVLHPDYSDLRCHRHGMLLATKMLLKNLWVQWHGNPPDKKLWRAFAK